MESKGTNEEFTPELRKELLDDFYAECDELLTSVKAGLALLEESHSQGTVDRANTESLFRSMHTLKGISSIVGLRSVEEIAHAVEEVLRGLTKQTLVLQPTDIDALVAAVHGLEQTVNAHRLHQAGPEMRQVLATIRRITPAEPAAPPAETDAPPAKGIPEDPVVAAQLRGLHPYLFTFTPAPALDLRGFNVNSARQRIEGLGEILSARPKVKGKGIVTFEFQVGLREKPAGLSDLRAEGISCESINADGAIPAENLPPSDSLPVASSQMVRVDLARLDDLMRITGELIVHRFRLEDRLGQATLGVEELKEISLAMSRSLREMRGAISRARLVPIAEVFARMPFVVRDLSRGAAKKAKLTLDGSQTEIDKYLVERLKEPLLHLIRNAFSHGIENPAERVAAGKSPDAVIHLSAKSTGEQVVIRVRDNGRGIDEDAVVTKAKSRGMTVPVHVDKAALLELICAQGFSTREEADMASGRGVGMAIVAATVRELGGTLALESEPGAFTEFTLRLPLSLSIADAIIVGVDKIICAVPQAAVREIVQSGSSGVRRVNGNELVPYREGLLPIVRLRSTFKMNPVKTERLTVLVVRSERGMTGLVVDRVLAQREVVIRPLLDPLLRVAGVSGATELGDGRPILILDPVEITNGVVRTHESDLAVPSRLS